MDFEITGRRALVMGSSQGIGRGIAESLIAEGAWVAISGRDAAKLRAVQADIGASHAIAADFRRDGEAKRCVREAIVAAGGLDILVVNTGGPPTGTFEEVTPEKWLDGFRGLWLSAVDAIQAALPGMRERKWGRIILITSLAAKEPIPRLTVSNGLRAGLLGLANSLSREIAADGVTVNAILPGYVNTARLRELGKDLNDIATEIPARRLGEPRELGDLAAFLCSNRSAYITGQAIAIDGGRMVGI